MTTDITIATGEPGAPGEQPKLYPAWRQVERDLLARGLRDGEVISMAYLRNCLGIEDPRTVSDGAEALRQQAQFNFAIGELIASLLENHRTLLRLVAGVGYMVVPPDEQTRRAIQERGAEISRILQRAELEVTHIRSELLTDSQRKENSDAAAKLGALRRLADKRLRMLGDK